MSDYYSEILDEIRNLLKKNRPLDASFLIRQELSMPYIPPETEAELKKLQAAARAAEADRREIREVSLETLLKKLKGNAASQLSAASSLGERNLRGCVEEIRQYLSHDPCPEAAALIIEAIAEQEIGEEFTFYKNGIICEFWGDSVVPCAKSGGFLKAARCLSRWLANENPSLLEMCRTLLTTKVYLFLPLSYEEEEGEDLALSVLEEVSGMSDGGTAYREVIRKWDLAPLKTADNKN